MPNVKTISHTTISKPSDLDDDGLPSRFGPSNGAQNILRSRRYAELPSASRCASRICRAIRNASLTNSFAGVQIRAAASSRAGGWRAGTPDVARLVVLARQLVHASNVVRHFRRRCRCGWAGCRFRVLEVRGLVEGVDGVGMSCCVGWRRRGRCFTFPRTADPHLARVGWLMCSVRAVVQARWMRRQCRGVNLDELEQRKRAREHRARCQWAVVANVTVGGEPVWARRSARWR